MDPFERFEDAKRLVSSESFLELTTVDKNIVIHPMFAGDLQGGIHDCLDKEKNLYSSRFGGVMLSYGNIKHYGSQAPIDSSTGFSLHRIRVDLIIFRPQIGSRMKAIVNKFGQDYIGCLVLNRFNALVPKEGNAAREIELGQEVSLVIKGVVFNRKILSLRGAFPDDGTKGKKKKEETSEDVLDTRKTLKTPKDDTPVMKKSKKRKRHQSSENEREEGEKTPKQQCVEGKSKRRSASNDVSQSPDSGGSAVVSIDSDFVDIPRTPSSSHKLKKKLKHH